MEELLLFIEERQTWIYVLVALVGLIYLRSLIQSYGELRRAIFALERERALSRLTRAAAILALAVAVIGATFVVATFASPALPLSSRETALPTVSLLATVVTSLPAEQEGFVTATPIESLAGQGAGCQNPQSTIISPENGESVSGVLRILGAANIQNFAFYKVEYKSLSGEGAWLTISAGTETVCEAGCDVEEELGVWDTSLVRPGEYALRLVVTDTAGNAPLPCEIRIRVLPSP